MFWLGQTLPSLQEFYGICNMFRTLRTFGVAFKAIKADTEKLPFTRAFAFQHSSINYSPAPDVVFLKLISPRVLFSGGVFFSQTPVWTFLCSPRDRQRPWRSPLSTANTTATTTTKNNDNNVNNNNNKRNDDTNVHTNNNNINKDNSGSPGAVALHEAAQAYCY